ncbi:MULTISPECIES: hypothetical protein [Photorhabdus]|uniref:hypothetical protein n=1 Tax=Photorhabdus TaxID=29487 RepID=UPI001EFE043A|nr:hypothetical protein [Photorhabdus sp. S14-60]
MPIFYVLVYTLWISRCIATARKRIPGSIANDVTGVSECSQQRGNLKDNGCSGFFPITCYCLTKSKGSNQCNSFVQSIVPCLAFPINQGLLNLQKPYLNAVSNCFLLVAQRVYSLSQI